MDVQSFTVGGLIGGVLGFSINALINHFLIKSRTVELRQKEEIDIAKRHFRSIVAQELADVRTRKHKFKDSSHINSLHAAMLDFQPFLSKDRQTSLNTAWKEYQEHEEYRVWTKPEEDSIMPVPPSWAKTEAIKYLENLLKFTE